MVVLSWLGYRLVEQDRILERQQIQQHAERGADLVVAALQRAASISEQRLASGERDWADGAAVVTFIDGRAEAYPRARIAYLPLMPQLPEVSPKQFAHGDELEFQQRSTDAAAQYYRDQAKSTDPAVRAGAWLRLARVSLAAGQPEAAMAAYSRLLTTDTVAIAGTPASLVGAYGQCKLLERQGRAAELRSAARRLATDLASARWVLTGPLYWLYAGDAARWSGTPTQASSEAEAFAAAADQLWRRRASLPSSGQESMRIGRESIIVLWQSSGGTLRALIASPAFIRSQWLPRVAAASIGQAISWHLEDANGQVVFGDTGRATPKATRSMRETGLPWMVVAAITDAVAGQSQFLARRRLLIAGLAMLTLMALTSSYLIARSVGRELVVARLQSDFVAAVSHEFRTPLTTLRQFTDMLLDRAGLSEERRQFCYQAQSRATDRLTRLVESLLDFGRMEAGARPFKFEPCDPAELVRHVVQDFQSEASAAEYEIHLREDKAAPIEMDREALERALWNLLENAVKYSPDDKSIEVSLANSNGSVRIVVRDRGIGIPADERSAIFGKFYRGSAARSRGIKGTGIGLTMAEHIVKAHQGRISLESEPGQGSTFTIVLPVKS
jgi:two-component system, OmpR family, phosphate regulon sensor histidine kinase PhoR